MAEGMAETSDEKAEVNRTEGAIEARVAWINMGNNVSTKMIVSEKGPRPLSVPAFSKAGAMAIALKNATCIFDSA